MDFTTGNLILSTDPQQFEVGVPTNQVISIMFLRDMDRSTFSDATVALEILGTVARVPISYSYANKILTITPLTPLDPSTTYEFTLVGDNTPAQDILTHNITGIKDILGNGMVGNYSYTFTTSASAVPAAPILVTPMDQTAIGVQPVFSWGAVVGATGYQIQVSTDNTFENIYWPLSSDTWNATLTTVQPARPFTLNQEYWWRVRATTTSAGSGATGPWSAVLNFYYGDPTLGTVTPDDAPLGVIPPLPVQYRVLSTEPVAMSSNLQPPDYPQTISVAINGYVDPSQITNTTLWVQGDPVDGIHNSGAFKPFFSPSLNGSVFGTGGITVPGPVDAYQQILASGSVQNPASIQFDGTNSRITLPIDPGYFQDNNLYTVFLNVQELASPIQWSFTSRWFPAFTSAHSVRQTTDHFMPGLTDDDLWFAIRRNSLNAIFLQIYPPTYNDGWSWVYQPPISFDVYNPLYFVREYVRIKTAIDIMQYRYFQLASQIGRKQLGDFTVDHGTSTSKMMEVFKEAIAMLEKELQPFLDKLHGRTNRGYAHGDWSQRSERIHVSNEWGYPFGHRGRRF